MTRELEQKKSLSKKEADIAIADWSSFQIGRFVLKNPNGGASSSSSPIRLGGQVPQAAISTDVLSTKEWQDATKVFTTAQIEFLGVARRLNQFTTCMCLSLSV